MSVPGGTRRSGPNTPALPRARLVLGALHLTTDTIRIGEARLKMGGLGWVATSARHRKRGIGRKLIEDALAYMREHGYHVSMLFGIPNFYHRFGDASALIDYTILWKRPKRAPLRIHLRLPLPHPVKFSCCKRCITRTMPIPCVR